MKVGNLKNLLDRFRIEIPFQNKKLPSKVSNSEKIARAVYSPINFKKGKLNNNFYKPPADSDEISVNRLDYTNPDFLKKLAINFENIEYDRNYFGFSVLNASEIRSLNFDIEYSPIFKPLKNIYHSDIKINYTVEKGVPLPSELRLRLRELNKLSRVYEDRSPSSKQWMGDKLN